MFSDHQGISYPVNETDDRYYVPFVRMQDFVRQTLEEKLRPEEVSALRKTLDKLKEKCNKQN